MSASQTPRNTIEYLARPPVGWFAFDVFEERNGCQDWCALMIDVHPDELKHRPIGTTREALLRIPGKHLSSETAWDALEDMLETRH